MSRLLDMLTVRVDETILDAVKCIESGDLQIAFVVEAQERLVGVVTNGDVRRYLLQGGDTKLPVTACMNRNFRAVGLGATREQLLKTFDLGYNALPGLDANGRLCEIYTRQMTASPEVPVLARARAPVRMSFCGGGADLTYFFVDHPAAVLSCTVGLYAHATLVPRDDASVHIYSEDIAHEEHYPSLSQLLTSEHKSLLATIVSVIRPAYGFDLYLRSDFSVGSGLGGSSAATTAIIAAFNELRQDRWNTYEIAELAFQAERLCFGIAGGWQDQYASAFGGFNLIEFENQRNLVHPIRLEEAARFELEACLVLCDTGALHDSGQLHEMQRQEMEAELSQTDLLRESVTLCRRMHRHLIRCELFDFGLCLHEAWMLKKQFSSAVSDDKLDDIYAKARGAGALGGKLLGAGAGGFFLFYVQPQHRQAVVRAMHEIGCSTTNFRFESSGVTSWRTKIQ
ncbi:sugar kinase [Halopseudomonas pachastrellae]|uniref:Sugar kinase n=2 Tax=Halopseudomonas pachastrellae TaxID=254161 RepID=A0A1S8DMB2_9GAMM|nr:CBS domain-containing protein [Halopseudomonas pachastrellae]ONM45790.1 sugar kinase [Halopseudomonas pachastrellae]SFL99601.1 D-glycero-alpha-D-manno-heptose-7-phosphate kinase [Halopseudomonas pachastrellae]